ncbi:MAG: DUF1345 domain-containing protein [Agriterribacter sp.]
MNNAANHIQLSWINRLHVIYKLLICAAVATAVPLVLYRLNINTLTRIILGWNVFCISMLSFYWASFFTTPQQYIDKEADKEDPSRVVVFMLLLICTFASMTAVVLLLTARDGKAESSAIQLPVALAGMILSWCVVHTIFTVRYAHLFYNGNEHDAGNEKGLEFPGEEKPDFLDFAYFSFVIGMTFQVSDVVIASKRIRRWALLHSLIAFAYNTVVVALTINIVAGLGK